MTAAAKLELRNGETIRAYLEELVRLKSPVQLWMEGSDATPFETTLQTVSPITFSLTSTPGMELGQVVNLSFMLDARRFITQGKVVAAGVFRIPFSIVQGERRGAFRAPFDRSSQAEVFAVEQAAGTVLGGRTILGRLLDLSIQGLRVALEEVGTLGASGAALKVGDVFQSVRITGLPLTPPIHCRGTVAHLGATEPYAGLLLEGISEGDQKNIERLLIPRLPATFGEVFPARRRKPDFADKLGAPTPTQIKAKAPELVGGALASAADRPDPSGRPAGALLRLRKSGKKILFLSGHPGTPALVDGFRQDGFRQVSEARSYQEAKTLAEQIRFDLVILDLRVGAHWAQDIMESLASHDLLLDTPVILVVEHRNEGVNTVARALGAVHVHDRRQSCAELLPVACRLLLD